VSDGKFFFDVSRSARPADITRFRNADLRFTHQALTRLPGMRIINGIFHTTIVATALDHDASLPFPNAGRETRSRELEIRPRTIH
jgi:hypothetical protein